MIVVVNGFACGQSEIKFIGNFYGAFINGLTKLFRCQIFFYISGLYLYGDLKIPDTAFLCHHFCSREKGDVFSFFDFVKQPADDFASVGIALEDFTPPGDMSAGKMVFFDQVNLCSHVGQLDGGTHSRNAGSCNDGSIDSFYFGGPEIMQPARFFDTRFEQFDGLLRSLFGFVGMCPRTLFPDVYLDIIIGIQSATPGHIPESHHMKLGRARSHNHGIQSLFFDVFHHTHLRSIGTGKHGCLDQCHARVVFQGILHGFHIHIIGNVPSAMADVNAYFVLSYFSAHDKLFKYLATSAAVPPADKMVSGISFGPEALPETNIPSLVVLEGLMNSSA